MHKSSPHWPSIVILVILCSAVALFLLAAMTLGIMSVGTLVLDDIQAAGMMILAVSAGLEGLLLAGLAWIVLRRISGHADALQPLRVSPAGWHLIIAVGVGIGALILGGAIASAEVVPLSWLMLPPLTLLLVALPISVLVGLGANRLQLGERWRAVAVFGVGMTLGPLIMIVLEVLLLIVAVIALVVVFVLQPELAGKISRLAGLLENNSDPEAALQVLGPYLANPGVIGALVGYLAVAVPLIEELFKPLGVWLFMRRIETPAQGFGLGVLSGAAYALVESLGASGDGSLMWTGIVAARSGTSILHVFTTGLMGWAIVSAARERRFGRLLATYVTVVILHGLWNASAAGIGLAILLESVEPSGAVFSVVPAAGCGAGVLSLGMLLLLIVSNRRLRQTPADGKSSLSAPTAGTLAGGQGVQ